MESAKVRDIVLASRVGIAMNLQVDVRCSVRTLTPRIHCVAEGAVGARFFLHLQGLDPGLGEDISGTNVPHTYL